MNSSAIISSYDSFKEKKLHNRFFKHHDILSLLGKLPEKFTVTILGSSANQRSINLVKWGNGETKIMLWSQMHGDEATGTMALFDLFNFLQSDDEVVKLLAENFQLYIIPMVNPDGTAVFTRRNAQQIDINRDFLKLTTPEAKILKYLRDEIQPDFGFNLHDQTTLWSVKDTFKPATLSFLAPAFDAALSINQTRKNAMLVIADMFKALNPMLPHQIGLFNDEFELRAFGDNFQKAGMATILIEAGGFGSDYEKQEIRKYYFTAILSGLSSIALRSYRQQAIDNYFAIPKITKQLFHILIQQVLLNDIEVSIGINYEEIPAPDGMSTEKIYQIEDIGDLSCYSAYTVYRAENYTLKGNLTLGKLADFELLTDTTTILSFKNGLLL